MKRIIWCIKQKRGLELIEPNKNLAEAYTQKAEESLEVMHNIPNKSWKISTAYYAMYFALYSILMRIGIKSEIHSCTLEFMKKFLNMYFDESDYELIEKAFKTRIDSQYYVNRNVNDNVFTKIIGNVPYFLIKCKTILEKMDEKNVKEIRNEIRKLNK